MLLVKSQKKIFSKHKLSPFGTSLCPFFFPVGIFVPFCFKFGSCYVHISSIGPDPLHMAGVMNTFDLGLKDCGLDTFGIR